MGSGSAGEGGLKCSSHPISATQRADVQREVNKIGPLTPDLLQEAVLTLVQLRKHAADLLATGPGSTGRGPPWPGLSPPQLGPGQASVRPLSVATS